MISGAKTSRAATLLLRGANDMHLDEMDRSLHDALCVVKRVLESGTVVPGQLLVVARRGQGAAAAGWQGCWLLLLRSLMLCNQVLRGQSCFCIFSSVLCVSSNHGSLFPCTSCSLCRGCAVSQEHNMWSLYHVFNPRPAGGEVDHAVHEQQLPHALPSIDGRGNCRTAA
jgi:hypothetical protein